MDEVHLIKYDVDASKVFIQVLQNDCDSINIHQIIEKIKKLEPKPNNTTCNRLHLKQTEIN